ncbi:GM17273 [Drosophila sechellia]|uniref:GM17273 n=1 Tax=Drosophila sechellia TaxID=7238 RepID=B4I5G3_DROSE|nr:GM17273 [Drosophila sechellia]
MQPSHVENRVFLEQQDYQEQENSKETKDVPLAGGGRLLFVFAVCLMLFRLLFRGFTRRTQSYGKATPPNPVLSLPAPPSNPSFALLTITHYV